MVRIKESSEIKTYLNFTCVFNIIGKIYIAIGGINDVVTNT